jgi:hypothetical protein
MKSWVRAEGIVNRVGLKKETRIKIIHRLLKPLESLFPIAQAYVDFYL